MGKFSILLILFISFHYHSISQEKKVLHISRTNDIPKIDAILDDTTWQNAEEAKDFIQFRPEMKVIEKAHQKTVVKMAYNDNAIFVAAYLYDDPQKIMKQYTSRDNFGQADFFAVIFNSNNDAQNDIEFFVFSSGTQADAVSSPDNGEDFGWNAVWESAVKIVEDGWIVEMKIPYSALRFSNGKEQTWGLQFHRHFRETRSQYSWNFIDRTKGNIGLYHGELQGIKNIKPPTRLSLYPFASTVIKTFDGNTEDEFNVGLDIKYGISENFTLDATLIPDFSQAGFDDVQLNLGPFEQSFSEQRQFFKEGVDLFNKGDLFYSRRIGNVPTGDGNLSDDEEFINSPDKIKTLNAVKVSGRTKKGLGVGFFNAITEKTRASIKNNTTEETRSAVVEPLTNYNILVLDQQFNKNSSISFINTNVTRNGNFRDANVTGLLFDLVNKKNTLNFEAEFKMSNLNLITGTQTGFSSEIEIGKIGGNYQYSFTHNLVDKKYDINDLGLQFRNNYNNFSLDASYRTFKPSKTLNNFFIATWLNYERLYNPSTYTGSNTGVRIQATTKKLLSFGGNANFEIGKQYDYFETRTDGRFYVYENWLNTNLWISSNYNKTFSIDANVGYATVFEQQRTFYNYWFNISPRVRFNDKFLVIYGITVDDYRDDRGFVTKVNNDTDIIFGERDRLVLENTISGTYNFNSLHELSLTFRNYWSTVTYDDNLFVLQDNGRLSTQAGYTVSDIDNPNVNFNTWNLDFSYSWQFAPGSLLTALYRNQLFNSDTASKDTYLDSLNTLFDQPIEHTFSLRMVYFIDYNNLKYILNRKRNSPTVAHQLIK